MSMHGRSHRYSTTGSYAPSLSSWENGNGYERYESTGNGNHVVVNGRSGLLPQPPALVAGGGAPSSLLGASPALPDTSSRKESAYANALQEATVAMHRQSFLADASMGSHKRKREIASGLESMIQGNPKQLLADSPIFPGRTQHQLPFSTRQDHRLDQSQAQLRMRLPDGTEVTATGTARTKKEAERVCAIDACHKLHGLGLLVAPPRITPAGPAAPQNGNGASSDRGGHKGSSAASPFADNPKNHLRSSPAFKHLNKGGTLPISIRSFGPDHSKIFTAELPVRLSSGTATAFGRGRNKQDAERSCCVQACEMLHQAGMLALPSKGMGGGGGGGGGSVGDAATRMAMAEQLNSQPAVVSLSEEEVARVVRALSSFQAERSMRSYVPPPLPPPPGAEMDDDPRQSRGAAASRRSRWDAGEDAQLKEKAEWRLTASELAEQRRCRESLPAWRERTLILQAVQSARVVVLTGETGCGKTTQVPQYILEDAEMQGCGSSVHIVCTQPRRIAAISVAERVAWERGESVGQSVGYSIRLDSVPPRSSGSILFCTTGVLLRRMQRPDGMSGVSHVVVDEVHERDCDCDFLLVILREMLATHPQLKVVVMSATLDAGIFQNYFGGGCPLIKVPGRTFPVQTVFLEELPRLMGQHCPRAVLNSLAPARGGGPSADEEEEVDAEMVAQVVLWVAQQFAEGDGAVLCFLPGWDTIQAVRDNLMRGRGTSQLLILPLHSQLPAGEQRAVFNRAPAGVRKVVLATNIAETSVTIDDVVYVVDTGRVKENSYDPSRNLTRLQVMWASQASVRQRQGRAGRVRPGHCFRLFTRAAHDRFLPHQVPEMQRVPLEELCLQIKALGAPAGSAGRSLGILSSDAWTFLQRAIQPPKYDAVHAAIHALRQLGALDSSERMTPLGRTLAKLGVHPALGKMLVFGGLLGCADPLLTVAAAACFRDPFLTPPNRRAEADRVKESFAGAGAQVSDQMVVARAFDQWEDANMHERGPLFAETNFLAQATLRLIAGMRRQFARTLAECHLAEPATQPHRSREEVAHVARCVMTAGLYPNVAWTELCRESKGNKSGSSKQAFRYRMGMRTAGGRVFLHPTSVITEKKLDQNLRQFIVFQEKAQTTQVFIRRCSTVPSLAVLLFAGPLRALADCTAQNLGLGRDWLVLEVESGHIRFAAERRTGELLLQLREAFDYIVTGWVEGKPRTEGERQVVESVIFLLTWACKQQFPD